MTLWTVAYQAPLSMGFSRQGYWSGLPCNKSSSSVLPPFLLLFFHTFPGPLLLDQLITYLNQGLPGPSPCLPVLSSSGSGVGLVFVLGCFPSYKPGEAGCWFLILQGKFRERNLNPVLSCGGRPGLDSFVTGQLVTPGAGLPQRPAAWFTPLSLGFEMPVQTLLFRQF